MAFHPDITRKDDVTVALDAANAAVRIASRQLTGNAGTLEIPNADGTSTIMGAGAGGTGVAPWVGDTTAPGKPLGITAESHNGAIWVSWNGTLDGGVPADFDHVQFTAVDGSQTVDMGQLKAAGKVTAAELTAGDTVTITAVAYDDAHAADGSSAPNASVVSDPVTVVVQSAVDSAAIQKAQSDAQAALDQSGKAVDTATAAKQTAQGAQTTADGKNKIFSANSEPAHTGLVPGDLWFQLDASSHVTGIQVWNGNAFVDYLIVANQILVAGSVGTVEIADGAVTADKLVANSVTALQLAANSVTADKIDAGAITASKIAAGQFKGYVFTGSIFQSSEEEAKGFKLKDGALDFWDANGNHTVHLDGDGKNNLVTGTFSTALTGRRVLISPYFSQNTVGTATQYTGSGIQFYLDGEAAQHPYIASESTTNVDGDVSGLSFNSGHRDENDPGAWMAARVYGKKGNRISHTTFSSRRNYDDATSPHALLSTHSEANSTSAIVEAIDKDGTVGMEANVSKGYLYLGGYLGWITGRATFQPGQWCAWENGMNASQSGSVEWAFTPTKYGKYRGVANVDTHSPDIQAHVHDTGKASSIRVMTKNYGGKFTDPVWISVFTWLVP